MTTKLLVQYQQAGLALVDPVAHTTDRVSKGIQFTDNVSWSTAYGDKFLVADDDGHIALYTKDLVFLTKKDLGNQANFWGSWRTYFVIGNYLYVPSDREHAGDTGTVQDAGQLKIRKFNRDTLELVSEAILSDPAIWDATTHTSLLSRNSGVILVNDEAWFMSGTTNTWYKVNKDTGVLLDTWVNGPSGISYASPDGTLVLDPGSFGLSSGVASINRVDFSTKTLTPVSVNLFTPGVTAGLWTLADEFNVQYAIHSFFNLDTYSPGPYVDVAAKKVYFAAAITQNDGPPEHTSYPRFHRGVLDLVTGLVTYQSSPINVTALPIPHMDFAAPGATTRYAFPNANDIRFVSPTMAVAWENNAGFYVMDFTGLTVTPFNIESQTNGYSGDAYGIRGVFAYNITEVVLTGLVTVGSAPAVPTAGRKVFVYDQETGEKIADTVSNNSGVYTLKKFTSRPAFGVAQSSGSSQDYLTRANWT